MQTAIGVDVAKDEVVIAYAQGGAQSFALRNQRPALKAWLKGVPKGSHIGVEATGSYHELIADLAFKAGMRVFVLNPKDTRHYAKGVGQRAKTDRVDAAHCPPGRARARQAQSLCGAEQRAEDA